MFRRKTAVLAIILTLALPWCAAGARLSFGPPALREASAPLKLFRAGFWNWLRNVWTKEGYSIAPSGAKAGCVIDPSGNPACGPTSAGSSGPAAPTSNAEVGCGIDPGGSPCGSRQ